MERFSQDEDKKYRRIFGGAAWPGKRPGFAVIVGQQREPPFDLVLLDEVEGTDIRQVVRACGGFDFFYRPEAWYGNPENRAACQFIREMNAETRQARTQHSRDFHLRRSPVLDLQNAFDYTFPTLKKLLSQEHLLLKEGKCREYMGHPQAADLPSLEWGDWPAIEALAFAVLELARVRDARPRPRHAKNEYQRI